MPRRGTPPSDPAPHGYDENGVPKAPYGLKADGNPRKDNRGGPGGGFGSRAGAARPSAKVRSLTDQQRKGMLCDLADSFLITPLAKASQAAPIRKKIGQRQADALAGDAFIAAQYVPPLADAMIVFSKTRPGVLAWMDKAEENAPWLMAAQVGLQCVAAIIQNHVNPNPDIAAAGRNYVNLRIAALAQEINRQANAARAQQQAEQEHAYGDAEDTQQFAAVA